MTPTPNRDRTIIGLTGLARSGKDTVGAHLVDEFGFTRVALADALKNAALALDPLIPDMDPADPTQGDFPTGHVRLSEYVAAFGWEEAKTNPEVRRTLQRLGSEAGWMVHGEDLWLRKAERTMSEFPGPVVITDIRMPHEAAWVRALGGKLWRVERPGTGLDAAQGTHVSEAGGFDVDRAIVNDGTLEQLYTAVERALAATTSLCSGLVGDEAHQELRRWLQKNQGRRVSVVRTDRELPSAEVVTLDADGVVTPQGDLLLDDGTRSHIGYRYRCWYAWFSPRVVVLESDGGYRDRSLCSLRVDVLD